MDFFFRLVFNTKSSWLILISLLILVGMLFRSPLLIFALCHGFVYGNSDYASNTVFRPFFPSLLSLPFSMESSTQGVARSDKV